jgi:hypothetical protein
MRCYRTLPWNAAELATATVIRECSLIVDSGDVVLVLEMEDTCRSGNGMEKHEMKWHGSRFPQCLLRSALEGHLNDDIALGDILLSEHASLALFIEEDACVAALSTETLDSCRPELVQSISHVHTTMHTRHRSSSINSSFYLERGFYAAHKLLLSLLQLPTSGSSIDPPTTQGPV